MGGGASKGYRLEAGNGQSAGPRPDWLQDPSKKLAPLSQNKFETLMGVGKGKFGFVYCAKHASKKCVAIKYISKSFVHQCKSIARINQEIALVQKIDHPYMVHCFGGFDTSECIALVFDYCMGGEFFTYLKKRTKISEGYAKFYFCEIALAISYLHETLGYVYRDLKPENILLDYDGHVRICDFGFAVPVGKGEDGQDIPLNDGCGTAMYVAPEIASGFMTQSHGYPVDWWGLGCVLVEMVTGNAPFGDIETSSKFEVFNNINGKAPALGMSMSGPLKKLCKGLLDKDASKRFSWGHVHSAEWCNDVCWEDLLTKSVGAPWVPRATSQPSNENFVSWEDMQLPASGVDGAAASYCASLSVPKPRLSSHSSGMNGMNLPRASSSSTSSPAGGGGGGGGRSSPTKMDRGSASPTTISASAPSRGSLKKQNTMSNLKVTTPDGKDGAAAQRGNMKRGKSMKNF